MNTQEFKAWFDGFTEMMDGPPSERAWKRILDRVATIKDAPPVDRHHFYNHYVRPMYPYGTIWTGLYGGAVGVGLGQNNAMSMSVTPNDGVTSISGINDSFAKLDAVTRSGSNAVPLDTRVSFMDLGRVEASLPEARSPLAKRALRRYQATTHMMRRLKEDRNQHYRDLKCACWTDPRTMARFKEQPQLCSCRGCGNQRDHEKGVNQLTVQERRAKEVSSYEHV